jgi:Family of unknown function (DUF6093)
MANSTGNRPIYRQGLIDKYLERYAEGNMQARVVITRGLYPASTLLYEGRARIHLQAGAVQMGFGDEPQYMVTGTISVPEYTEDTDAAVLPRVNDLILCTESTDSRAAGRTFRVMHIDVGGQYNGFLTMSVIGSEDSPSNERTI